MMYTTLPGDIVCTIIPYSLCCTHLALCTPSYDRDRTVIVLYIADMSKTLIDNDIFEVIHQAEMDYEHFPEKDNLDMDYMSYKQRIQ